MFTGTLEFILLQAIPRREFLLLRELRTCSCYDVSDHATGQNAVLTSEVFHKDVTLVVGKASVHSSPEVGILFQALQFSFLVLVSYDVKYCCSVHVPWRSGDE